MSHLLLLTATSYAALTPEETVRRDDLLASLDRYFEGAGPPCAPVLVQQIKDAWSLFDAADQERITTALAPLKAYSFLDSPPPPPLPAGYSCFGPSGRYQLTGAHFSVEWDERSVEPYAATFLTALEESWSVEVDDLGWDPFTSWPSYPMLAYINDDPYVGGAYTTLDWCGSIGAYVPYVVAESGSWADITWANSMAAHEFNHALQFSMTWEHEYWWWEATATYMEESVYPTPDWWAAYVEFYTTMPWMAMNASSSSDSSDAFWHMYGMAIMGFHLDNHFGGPSLMLQTWQYGVLDESRVYDLYLPDVLEDMGYDWDAVYTQFMADNTVMDYDEGSDFPDVTISDTVSSLPASGRSTGDTQPESLGQNYVKFPGSMAVSGKELEVTFHTTAGRDWYALLVRTTDAEVLEIVDLAPGATGLATGRIAFDGDDAWLVVAPWDPSVWGGDYDFDRTPSWGYSWEAALVDPLPVDTGLPPDTAPPVDTARVDTSRPPVDTAETPGLDSGLDSAQPDSGPADEVAWVPRLPPSCACASARRPSVTLLPHPPAPPPGAGSFVLATLATLLLRRRGSR